MKKTGLFTFVLIIAVSCLNEPDCYQLNNDTAVIYFRIIGGGSDAFQLTSIVSPESDSTFYGDTTLSMIILPLNPKTEETHYTLHGPDGENTLLFGYQRQVQFVSAECGERYYFQNLDVLEHDFDSVRVVNTIPTPTPTPTGAKNIEIYRCATTNLMRINFKDPTIVQGITSDFMTIVVPPGTELHDFVLPLNTNNDSTTYQFDFGDDVKTLRVRYSRTPGTLASQCGEQTFLDDLQVSNAVTDMTTVVISNDSIQDLPIKNLEITP
jgi:hypothetical protein